MELSGIYIGKVYKGVSLYETFCNYSDMELDYLKNSYNDVNFLYKYPFISSSMGQLRFQEIYEMIKDEGYYGDNYGRWNIRYEKLKDIIDNNVGLHGFELEDDFKTEFYRVLL